MGVFDREVGSEGYGADAEGVDGDRHRTGVFEEAEGDEHIVPVVDAALSPEQRQFHGGGIPGVYRYIKKILADPEQHQRTRVGLVIPEEMEHEQGRHEELQERPADHMHEMPERQQKHMAGFMNHQIHPVQQPPFGWIRRAEEEVGCGNQSEDEFGEVDGLEHG